MKKVVLLLISSFFMVQLSAQNDKKNQVGSHTSFGTGTYGIVGVGGGDYKVKYYYTLGLDYSRQLSKRWDLCSGVEYTYDKMTLTAHDDPTKSKSSESLTLATIPVQFKYHFGKIVYLNSGILFNILAKTSNEAWVQSRNKEYKPTNNVAMFLGFGLGIGFEHEFDSGVMLSLNPYVRWNGIGNVGSFLYSTHTGNHIFLQSGISLGIGYKF